jgi:flavin-dependent dehydrogenase
MTRTFDAIIIGAGQAGPSLAGRLTAAGQSVALIERKLFGGTCVNTGCTARVIADVVQVFAGKQPSEITGRLADPANPAGGRAFILPFDAGAAHLTPTASCDADQRDHCH